MNQPKDPTDKTNADEAEQVDADRTDADDRSDATVSESDADIDLRDYEDQAHDEFAEEPHSTGSSFASTALKLVLLVLVIFGLSLWLVPMAAPYVPTSIAKHIMPGQQVLDERLAAIEAKAEAGSQVSDGDVTELRQQVADLTTRLAAAEETVSQARSEAEAAKAAAETSAGAVSSTTIAESVVTDARAAAEEAAQAAETATAAATEAGKVASSATRDTASLARQMTSFEGRLAGLKSEVEAIGTNLAEAAKDGGASSGEVTAAFAALKAKVDALAQREPDLSAFIRRDESDGFATHDDLRSARTALEAGISSAVAGLPEGGALATTESLAELRGSVDGQLAALKESVAEVGATATSAVETAAQAEAAATEAVGSVGDAIRRASLNAAVAAMQSRMSNGLPFSGALDEVTKLTGATPPEALALVAANGSSTSDHLLRTFGTPASRAIAEDLKAQSGDSTIGQAGARLEALFSGRPKDAQETSI
ncbi:MAG: hypothetical protein AAF479_08100 [Pseudomonadota bacterium]